MLETHTTLRLPTTTCQTSATGGICGNKEGMISTIPGKIISAIVFSYIIFAYNEVFLVYPVMWNFVITIRNKIRC
tara:strand:+ start:121 stop:345 length:225 start_codon:yes stop_codon:yes gene_type:complete